MKPVRPVPEPAGLGDLLLARPRRPARRGRASKPAPGLIRLPASRPSVERDDRRDEEVAERPQREAAGPRHVAERGDADDDGDEDHRRGDRLDELQERVREPLRLRRRPGRDEPEHDAGGDRDQHPEPQLPLHGSELLSSLSTPRPAAARSAKVRAPKTALSCLWSLWSKVSLWSRENHAADAGAEPRRAPAGPPAHGRRGHRRRRRADHRARRARADRDRGARPQPHRRAHRRRAAGDPAGAGRSKTRARASSPWPKGCAPRRASASSRSCARTGPAITHPRRA